MDSTPSQIPNARPNPNPNPIRPSPRKLPIKRRSSLLPDPNPSADPSPNLPNPRFEPSFPPDGDAYSAGDASDDDDGDGGTSRKPPPFKFHRIWTETDEIRFLQGLLDCGADGLYFPRDLQIFYGRFSGTMSQPYTKSQLSEKLRRLRKKFRVTSSRLARGLDTSKLSPHDRELFELSKKLWHPEHPSASPFSNPNCSGKKKMKHVHDLVGVEVNFSPTLPFASSAIDCNKDYSSNEKIDVNQADNYECNLVGGDGGNVHASEAKINNDNCVDASGSEANVGNDHCVDLNMSGMKLESSVGDGLEEMRPPTSSCGGLGRIAARTAINVFDQSLKELRMVIKATSNDYSKHGKAAEFEKRWREQQVAELDVLARRLRLVLENVLQGQ